MSLPSEEQWRPVVGYEGLYEVSDHGRVRSLDRMIWNSGKSRGYHQHRGKMLKLKRQPDGRVFVILHRDGMGSSRRVSVLVLEAFVGARPTGFVGCHNDGDINNNTLANLRWDTQAENIQDIQRHGRCPARNRTHCPRGHALTVPNLVAHARRKGYRSCLACARARATQQQAEKRREPIDFTREADARYADIMGAADRAIHHAADRAAS